MKDQGVLVAEEVKRCMHCYQKENNIKDKCMTNCQTLLDILRDYYNIKGAKSRACICVGFTEVGEIRTVVDRHLVVEVEGEIIDPSYCVDNLKNKKYYYKYIDFMNKYHYLVSIKKFEGFKKRADEMNNNKFLVCDPSYYDNQFIYMLDRRRGII